MSMYCFRNIAIRLNKPENSKNVQFRVAVMQQIIYNMYPPPGSTDNKEDYKPKEIW